jgi:hypothetical protein
MACSKYTLTNTGSTTVNFNYQRCDDTLWQYQIELLPGQTKNIWLVNGTYSSAQLFQQSIVLVDDGAFPPPAVTPTPTPTPSVTPTITPTITPTASVTPTVTTTSTVTPTPTTTQTPTPTNVARTEIDSICHSEFNGTTVCDCPQTATIWVNGTSLADSTLVWSNPTGVNTGNPEGWYLEDGIIYEVSTDCGPGCISGSTIIVNGPCPSVTPTPTPTVTTTTTVTPTITTTTTETPTPTPTTTVTPTNARFEFASTSGSSSYEACHGGSSVSIWGDNVNFDQNIFFYDSSTGPVTTDMAGFYSYNGVVTQVDSDGSQLGVFTLCASPTPTPTVTPTASVTPTVTPTLTPTPTQTIGYYTYSLGFDAISAGLACNDFSSSPSNYYAPLIGGPGPNVGEFLYTDSSTTTPAPDGYYSNGVAWYLINGGAGEVTSTDPNGCSNLPTSTPTPTVTPTISLTPTQTPTITPTNTSTPTPTPTRNPDMIGINQSITDAAIIDFVDDGGSIPLIILSGAFPVSSGVTLNAIHGATFGNPRASITGSSVNYIVELNGSFLLSGTTNPPSVIGLTSGGVALLDTDVSKITLLD